jgi:hypothetical protein
MTRLFVSHVYVMQVCLTSVVPGALTISLVVKSAVCIKLCMMNKEVAPTDTRKGRNMHVNGSTGQMVQSTERWHAR